MAVCIAPKCGRPSFDGQPGSFCSKTCRDSQKPVSVTTLLGRLVQGAPANSCQAPNCNRPTYDGKPGYCSKRCKSSQISARPQVAATAVCSTPGCQRSTFDGQPGFCTKSCRNSLKSSLQAAARNPEVDGEDADDESVPHGMAQHRMRQTSSLRRGFSSAPPTTASAQGSM
ncbi:unnamed protein product [Symbiodinium sp. CCMP2592]|nr:unnamed protein product [Symbiodinium sp. CCMP2592]